MASAMKLPNQEKIRTLGVKVTDKYLGLLEFDTIKKWRWKKKLRVSQENQKATWDKTI